ncbi:MAG: AraC family transcriptional regulator, partial [Muribaculaceae bacterium]|nr:AraC family transcriptional regulator [Muribaculaceae bacterium]
MEKQNIILDSINAYNSLYGLPTHHPLVAVVDLKQSSAAINHIIVNYGIYALFLKNGVQCTLRYGRRKYDYQEGSVVSFSPGQVVEVEMDHDIVGSDVIGLLFHPDLIYGTPLADKMPSYSFFDYTQNEAVHLSADEKEKFLSCISLIKEEIEHPVDNHSAAVLSANIQVLMEYLHRFYD